MSFTRRYCQRLRYDIDYVAAMLFDTLLATVYELRHVVFTRSEKRITIEI